MKNIIRSLMIATTAVAIFGGCAKEETQDPYAVNWAYLEAPKATEYAVEFNSLREWITKPGDMQTLTRLRCTKPAPATVTATVEIDESLVAIYNEKNGTSYALLPGATLVKDKFVIEKGQYVSADSIKVQHENWDQLMDGGTQTYILPVTMTSLKGDVRKSESSTVFLIYETTERIAYASSGFVGTEITDKSAWTATSSTGVDLPKTINGSDSDYTWIRAQGQYQDGTETIVLDLGTTYSVKCFGLVYYAWYYSCADYTLEYSVDGENYIPIGFFENPGNKTLTTTFYAPVEARYFRFHNGLSYYDESYGALINEIKVFTE